MHQYRMSFCAIDLIPCPCGVCKCGNKVLWVSVLFREEQNNKVLMCVEGVSLTFPDIEVAFLVNNKIYDSVYICALFLR